VLADLGLSVVDWTSVCSILVTDSEKGNVLAVVNHLQKERTRLEDELHRVTAALTAFGNVCLRGRKSSGKKRTISVAGRKRIAAAQRARWAKVRAKKAA
jgi:hypothetical protein